MISDVYMAPRGKVNYFFPDTYCKKNSREEYLSLFENAESKKAIGEYAGYIDRPNSAELIKKTIPNAKIIFCLRNPIERAFSHYLGALRSHDEEFSFEDSFEKFMNPIDEKSDFYNHYIRPGLYFENVRIFMDIFGKENIKIVIFEEFVSDTKSVFQEILDFLEIKTTIPSNVGETYNAYAEPLGNIGTALVKNKTINRFTKKILPASSRVKLLRILTNKRGKKPEMQKKHKKILEKVYMDDSKKLEKLLGRELFWEFLRKS